MKNFPPYLLLLLNLCPALWAADLTSSGDWSRSVDADDLTAGAGSDLAPNYLSDASTTLQTITITNGGTWVVKARKSDIAWSGNLQLLVKRTSDGSGSGSISGGTQFIPLNSLDTEIFSGSGSRDGVALQYRLTGMSVAISPATYSTEILFTVE